MATQDPQQTLAALARRLARRYLARLRWRNGVTWSGLAAGAALILAAAKAAWWVRSDWNLAFWALGAIWLVGLGTLWWRARADAMRLLGDADRQVAGEEQLITAYELEQLEPANPFLPILRKRCDSLVKRVDPRALIPMQMHRPAMGALVFAVVAFALFLMPSEWLHMTRAALTPGQSLVSEEGARIRRFAERMEEVAKRENMPFAQTLAKEAQVIGKAMEEKKLSALDASEQVEGLIRLAEELAKKKAGKGKDGFTGEQNVGFESESQNEKSTKEGGASGYTGGGDGEVNPESGDSLAGGQNPETPNMSSVDDPFNDQEPPENSEKNKKDRDRESELLERAQTQFQQAQRSMEEGGHNSQEQEGVASSNSKDAMDDASNATQENNNQNGQEQSASTESPSTAGQDATPSDAFGQGATDQDRGRTGPDDKPKDSGFEDSQIFGLNSGADAEEKWVRQLPTLNAREIRPDGSLQDFQQAAVQAQGGSAIPRAYRAVVRSYFMHLERLNIDLEFGDLAPPPVEAALPPKPATARPDQGRVFGPEFQGGTQEPADADGGRGPQD